MSDIRARRKSGMWKDLLCDAEGYLITHPYIIDEVLHPFARGAGTATGAQYCTEKTQAAATATDETVEEVLIDFGLPGKIMELEFGLTGSFAAAASATADLIYTWQARSVGRDTWVNLAAAVTKTDIGTTNVEETYSGIFGVSTGANPLTQLPSVDLSTVPFRARLLIQSNEASQAQGKTKNSSYFRVKFIPN